MSIRLHWARESARMRPRGLRVHELLAAFLGLVLMGSGASAAPLLEFDFENTSAGDATAAASFSVADLSGGVFAGTKNDSAVLAASGNLLYRSAALFPAFSGGGFFNFFTFTAAKGVQLLSLEFEAGQNDTTVDVPRNFDVLLSPVDAPVPVTDDQRNTLGAYTLLDTIAVPDTLLGGPFSIDLSGYLLAPGTYSIAFAVAPGAGIVTGTTQLFMDNVRLSGFVVPEPATLALLAFGLIGIPLRRRAR